MKSLLEKLLAVLAQKIIKKYNPKIIGITGSMGKTSAKEAVFAVLKEKFQVRKNIKNYNNEIGVPLTVIGAESGGSSVFRWLLVILRAFGLLLFKKNDYPEVLVLEMGADKPGDIQYLVEKFPCDVGVLTMIGPAHLENFKTLENIVKEKQKIVTHLSKKGQAIINSDDPQQKQVKDKVEATVLTYGSSEDSDLRGADLSTVLFDSNTRGVKFKILYKGSAVPVDLPGVIGAHQINAALIGSLVGLSLELNLVEISRGLKNYKPPKGRMNLIKGKNCLVIDDTYNSSPKAAKAAIKSLNELKTENNVRKVAVMGDMLELGNSSKQQHFELGKFIAESGIDVLVTVGKYKEQVKKGAESAGLSGQNIYLFSDSRRAETKIIKIIQKNDIVLVKGSQGSRMERIVKKLMAETSKAGELLVRQSDSWLKKS